MTGRSANDLEGAKMAVTTERPVYRRERQAFSTGFRRAASAPPIGTAINRTKPTWEKPYLRRLVFTDFLIVVALLGGSQIFWFGIDNHHKLGLAGFRGDSSIPYWTASLVLGLAWLTVLKLYGTRDPRIVGSGFGEYARVADASFRLFGLVGIAALLLQFAPARGYIITAFPLGVVLIVASRWGWRQWLRAERRRGRQLVRVLLVGSPSSVEHVHTEFARRKYLGFEIVGACLPASSGRGNHDQVPVPRLGDFDEVAEVARRERVHAVALAGSEELPPHDVRRIGWDLESTGVDLMVTPAITEVAGTRIHTRPVGGMPLMYVESPSYEGGKKIAKTVLDFSIAIIGLILVSPIMIGAAIAVRVSSPGPILFRQQRIGLNGEAFNIYKFRSMRASADAELAELLRAQGTADTPLFKVDNDPRITRVGAFLRKYSIDELPQLLNVVRGEMSLVGPRPQRAEEVALYDHAAGRRLLVKPGITGLWQVSGRSDLSWEDTVRLDLYYAENWSFTDDFVILLYTVKAVLQPSGAR